MSEKYLRKNEFRYSASPSVRREDGKGHVVYVTVVHDDMAKVNVVTHSRRFFGEKTYRFQRNPQINARDKRQSRYSVPRWISKHSLWKPRGVWHIDNRDRKAIHKLNRTYKRRYRKNK